ncbi:hypothetical protein EYC80_003167 [Monilinia laxa]|uniref:Uncharacterized protein n=1 Tax=Monilinia laxa TaxID=61186 RepID=A0A5N6KD38_MONLA|nr:hypothetical protein EYC80_003167 [Monilinia laxa]
MYKQPIYIRANIRIKLGLWVVMKFGHEKLKTMEFWDLHLTHQRSNDQDFFSSFCISCFYLYTCFISSSYP